MLVLVADDDTTCRLMAKAAVEQLGHECVLAEDGAKALEMVNTCAVDVLIADWLMPGMNGPELCRRIRGSGAPRYPYIIIATTLGERDDIIEGIEAGADDYIIKPLDPFQLQIGLIAATRVAALHQQLVEIRHELEMLKVVMHRRSRIDPLTQLGNRLRLHEDLEQAHHRALRYHKPYTVAVCDIDRFKPYNDTNGHVAGDEALCRVAQAIADDCRANERAYCYGGGEFVIVYSDEPLAGAVIAGERLRQAVEALAIPNPSQTAAVMTISIGIATWDQAIERDADAVLEVADRALYAAKDRGRNQVVARGVHVDATEGLVAETRR